MLGLIRIMTNKNIVIDKLLDNILESLIHEKNYQIDKYLDSNITLSWVHLGIFNPETQPLLDFLTAVTISKVFNIEIIKELRCLANSVKNSLFTQRRCFFCLELQQ
ncbi:MAG: hypothetical protein ACFFAJ_06705 [Candidatus Hodarchaeota archaeon]